MSHYVLTIHAEGPHHTNTPDDAYPKALAFAKELGAMGHKIRRVEFAEDTKAANTALVKATEAARIAKEHADKAAAALEVATAAAAAAEEAEEQ